MLTEIKSERLHPASLLFASVAEDDEGNHYGWIRTSEKSNQESQLNALHLPCATTGDCFRLMQLLIPWRIVKAARIELGSTMLVLGDSWLVTQVLQQADRHGVLTQAATLPYASSSFLQLHRDDLLDAQCLKLQLKAKIDAVVVLDCCQDYLKLALRVCDSLGTVVVWDTSPGRITLDTYPDIHKRGLHLVCIDPVRLTPVERANWDCEVGYLSDSALEYE